MWNLIITTETTDNEKVITDKFEKKFGLLEEALKFFESKMFKETVQCENIILIELFFKE